ncbi:MAG: phage integrase SAM-like domain-containing protein, partial [Muribaculaceae bacterium]|nr:phage integrase SAM-like domain-containing protein [Muribaculaceae bacterium]
MTTIKVTLHTSAKKLYDGTICYQIKHLQKVRYIRTSYHILTSEWDDRTSRIIISPHSERRTLLTGMLKRIRCDMTRIYKITQSLESLGLDYTTDDIIHEYCNYLQQYNLTGYMRHIISVLEKQGRIRTSETYRSTLNSFMRFLNYAGYASETFMLDNITSDILEAYEVWQHSRGIVANTISFYNRILRAVYNRAVTDGIIDDSRPFRHVYTGIGKTVKRALPLSVISKIKSLDLSSHPKLDYARDIFIMSFYMRGMSFIDMAMLR